MLKFVIAGMFALTVAGLGIGGYQAGVFDSFKPKVQDTGKVDEAPAPATDAEPEVAASAVLPTFDVVRIEPTGDAVVAGLSAPKATVALVANGKVVGKTTANTSGEWAIVLSSPLEPGDYDVAIHAASEDGKTVESTQRVTVSIPKTKDEDVLVVMNAEGEASTILQKPAGKQTAGESVVAQADQQATGEQTRAAAALQEKPAAGTSPDDQSNTPGAQEVAAQSATGETADTTAQPAPETTIVADALDADAEKTATPVIEAEAEVAQAENSEPQRPEPSVQTETPAPEAGVLVASDEPKAEVAVETPSVVTAPVVAPEEQSAEASVEVPAAQGETVVAVAPQESPVVPEVAPDAAAQSAQKPASEPAVVSAPATETTQQPVASPDAVAAVVASESVKAVAPVVSVEAVESEKGQLYVAGTSDPGSSVRVYVGKDHVGDTKTNESGRWLLETDKALDAGQHEVRADQVQSDKGDVIARAEVTFEREKDDIILRPVVDSPEADVADTAGDAESVSVAQPPNVIIRRGDNLWRISQRLYGQGVRYTTIYQANKDQIRDPDLIYPGQIFLTPEADASWDKVDTPAN